MVIFLKLNLLLSIMNYNPTGDTIAPILSGYKISDCQQIKYGNSFLIYSHLINGELQIKLGAYLNCIVDNQTSLTFQLNEDTLNLFIPEYKEIIDTVISKSDSSDTFTINQGIQTTKCDCYFKIYLGIKNCYSTPNVITINGSVVRTRD